jgi:hypothetical protein
MTALLSAALLACLLHTRLDTLHDTIGVGSPANLLHGFWAFIWLMSFVLHMGPIPTALCILYTECGLLVYYHSMACCVYHTPLWDSSLGLADAAPT